MQKDLFENKAKRRRTKAELSLSRYDKNSFQDRLKRVNLVIEMFPNISGIFGDHETVYILRESKMAFINGEFIATILLSQAFIERSLHLHLSSIGLENEARKGIKNILKLCIKYKIVDEFLINKIELLRKKRNPFTHVKPYGYEFTISQRIQKEFKEPICILEKDAEEALSLMNQILITRYNSPKYTKASL